MICIEGVLDDDMVGNAGLATLPSDEQLASYAVVSSLQVLCRPGLATQELRRNSVVRSEHAHACIGTAAGHAEASLLQNAQPVCQAGQGLYSADFKSPMQPYHAFKWHSTFPPKK